MLNLNQAEWLALIVAALIAVSALVKLMRARRDQLLAQLRDQMESEKRRRHAEQRRQEQTPPNPERKAS